MLLPEVNRKSRTPRLVRYAAMMAALLLMVTGCAEEADPPPTTVTETTPDTQAPTTTSTTSAAPTTTTEAAAADPIVIGILYSATGPAGVFGPPVENIAQLIEADLNAAGGILGRAVETVMADDATDPEVGRAGMERLLDEEQVDVVIGTHSSATRAAAKPLAEAADILYIYAALYEGGECSSVMFNTGEVPSQQLQTTIPWMMEDTGGTTWFLIGNDYLWPRRSFEWARQYIEAAGGEVVGEEYVPLGTTDFSSVAQQISAADPDLIFPALVGGDAIAFETQAFDFGIGQAQIPRLANIYEENVIGAMGPSVAAGMRVTLGYFKEAGGSQNARFVERYLETFGADAAPHATFSSHVYDAALLYAEAVTRAGTTETAAVAEAMIGVSLETPSGHITVTDSRHLTQPIYVVEVQEDGSQTVVQTFEGVFPEESCTP